jgi:hypothetical protein
MTTTVAFEVITAGESHVFDSLECAIHALAPICEHCGCGVIGRGVQVDGDGALFCRARCARAAGKSRVQDRV